MQVYSTSLRSCCAQGQPGKGNGMQCADNLQAGLPPPPGMHITAGLGWNMPYMTPDCLQSSS